MYRWIEHTAELELSIEAPDEPAVFADAFDAFVELVRDGDGPDAEQLEIEIEAESRDLLLADWLEELVFLADARGFVPGELAALSLDDGRLRALVRGYVGEPSALVKAVTRHGLAFEPDGGGGWRASVVLDV